MSLHPEQIIEAGVSIVIAAATGAGFGLGFFVAALLFTDVANAVITGSRVGVVVALFDLILIAAQTIHSNAEEE